MYRSALKMAKTDSERKRIIAIAEGFLGTFYDSMMPIAGKIASDPKLASDLIEAAKSGKSLVSDDGSNESGS